MDQWIWCVIGLVVLVIGSGLCSRWGSNVLVQPSYSQTLDRLLRFNGAVIVLAIALQWSRWGRTAVIVVVVSVLLSILRYVFVSASLEAERKRRAAEVQAARKALILEQHDEMRRSISESVANIATQGRG